MSPELEAAMWELYRAAREYRNCWTLEGGKMSVSQAARGITDAVSQVERVLKKEQANG